MEEHRKSICIKSISIAFQAFVAFASQFRNRGGINIGHVYQLKGSLICSNRIFLGIKGLTLRKLVFFILFLFVFTPGYDVLELIFVGLVFISLATFLVYFGKDAKFSLPTLTCPFSHFLVALSEFFLITGDGSFADAEVRRLIVRCLSLVLCIQIFLYWRVIEKHTLQYFVLNTIVLLGAIYCSLLILSGLGVIDLGGESRDWPIVWRNADSISKTYGLAGADAEVSMILGAMFFRVVIDLN